MKLSELMKQSAAEEGDRPEQIKTEDLQAGDTHWVKVLAAKHRSVEGDYPRESVNFLLLLEDGDNAGKSFWTGLTFWPSGYNKDYRSLEAIVGDEFLDMEPDWPEITKKALGWEGAVTVGFRDGKNGAQYDDFTFSPRDTSSEEPF